MTAFSRSPAEARLLVFSGLPGVGKTTLARRLATRLHAAYLRIDTLEQGIRDLCGIAVQGEGYRLAYRIAADNLRLGVSVVADSCNPIELTRREWAEVAAETGVSRIDVQVVCSDALEHRSRIETRVSSVPNLRLPNWDEVRNREYHPWTGERILIDTAGRDAMTSFRELLASLGIALD